MSVDFMVNLGLIPRLMLVKRSVDYGLPDTDAQVDVGLDVCWFCGLPDTDLPRLMLDRMSVDTVFYLILIPRLILGRMSVDTVVYLILILRLLLGRMFVDSMVCLVLISRCWAGCLLVLWST